MVCTFAFLVLAVAAIVIPLAVHHSKQTAAAWEAAARTLSLRFEGGGFFQGRRIHGRMGEFHVEVDTVTRGSGKNSRTYTRFAVHFPRPLGLGLKLTAEGFFSGVSKFFGAQDIEIDDDIFDRDVLVKGADPRGVAGFLTPARRLRIHRFLTGHGGAVIEDHAIRWETYGVVREAARLVEGVQTLGRLAWHLSGDREEDRRMQQAMEAQHRGHPEQALDILRRPLPKTPPLPPAPSPREDEEQPAGEFHPHGVEEQLLKGELLYLADRREEAKEVFEEALAEAPGDKEVRDWVEHAQDGFAPSAPSATATQTGAGSPSLAAAAVCQAVFDPNNSSIAASRLFEDRYAGRPIRWRGLLRKAEPLYFDLVFKDSTGCKAMVEVHEMERATYGERKIVAVVQFPEEDLAGLNEREGSQIEFTGRLKKADGLLRNIFVAEGRLAKDSLACASG